MDDRNPERARDRDVERTTTVIDTGGRGGGGAGVIIAVLGLIVIAVALFGVFGGFGGSDEGDINVNVAAPNITVPDVEVPDVTINPDDDSGGNTTNTAQ